MTEPPDVRAEVANLGTSAADMLMSLRWCGWPELGMEWVVIRTLQRFLQYSIAAATHADVAGSLPGGYEQRLFRPPDPRGRATFWRLEHL